MYEFFGEEYRLYIGRTGRIMPANWHRKTVQ
jgi:hypothetical protein